MVEYYANTVPKIENGEKVYRVRGDILNPGSCKEGGRRIKYETGKGKCGRTET